MKKRYQLLLWIVGWLSVSPFIQAQNSASNNVIPNGGFEDWIQAGTSLRPDKWYFNSELNATRIEDDLAPGTTGRYAVKMYAGGGGFFLLDAVPVEPGKSYTFSFWYKSTKLFHRVKAEFSWYKDGAYIKKDQVLQARKPSRNKWEKAETKVTVPSNANRLGVEITPEPSYSNAPTVIMDDILLVLSEGGSEPAPSLKAPQNVKIQVYQGEMDLTWDRPADANGMKWEIMLNDKVVATVTDNSHTLTKLTPGTAYRIKLRALKGEERSAYAEKTAATQNMSETEHSLDRVPYLRTIGADGICDGRFLKLYYNELANPNAKIIYKLDGRPVQPKNDILEFPAFNGDYAKHQLEIYIDEDGGKEWEILYNELTIKNI